MRFFGLERWGLTRCKKHDQIHPSGYPCLGCMKEERVITVTGVHINVPGLGWVPVRIRPARKMVWEDLA